jgi:predicted NUDIX family NTP pyrophosphohydrolase
MPVVSAGLMMCRPGATGLEVLLVHPGGPFYARKDDGAWSIPKGLVEAGEDPLAAAQREFAEETGIVVTADRFYDLGSITTAAGKLVHAWAFWGDADPTQIRSNTFELEWPPRSGRRRSFPEVDRAAFFDPAQASIKINERQRPLVERAREALEAT